MSQYATRTEHEVDLNTPADPSNTTSYTTFLDCCPSCGRRVLIGLSFLGQNVCCSHCHKEFLAQGQSHEANDRLSQRIEQLLLESGENRALFSK